MASRAWRCVVWVVLVSCLSYVDAGLTISKKCGEKTCGSHEFCSDYDQTCVSCNSVCELGQNYQEDACQKDCQDYLHARHFVQHTDMDALRDDIQQLYMLVTVVLVISVIILIAVVGVLAYFVLKAKKRNSVLAEKIRKKINTINALQGGNNNVAVETAVAVDPPRSVAYKIDGGALRLDVMSAATAGGMAATSTPVRPARYAAEDATLEYGGYDNPGLHVTPSPVFDGDAKMMAKKESSF